MLKNFTELNSMADRVAVDMNHNLDIQTVVIMQSMETPKHYTISTLLLQELSRKIYGIAKELYAIDNSLILNEPELYHFTTFWCPLSVDIEKIKDVIATTLATATLSFTIKRLLFGCRGICIKLYPRNNTFNQLRQQLSAIANIEYKQTEMSVTTWVSMARYSQVPKQELKDYVEKSSTQDLGSYTPKTIDIFTSSNKNFSNVVKIASYNNIKK